MPVSNASPYISYAASGGNTYNFAFKVFDVEDVVVKAAGAVKMLGTDYDVAITPAPGEGGSIVFRAGRIPAVGSGAVEIQRAISLDRTTDYQESGGFRQAVVDKDFDRTVMLIQDRERRLTALEGGIVTLAARETVSEHNVEDLQEAFSSAATKGYVDTAVLNHSDYQDFTKSLHLADSIIRFPLCDVRSFIDGIAGRPTLAAWLANPTGVDVTACFQAAVDSVIAANGGTVFVPTGRYLVNGTVYVNPAIQIPVSIWGSIGMTIDLDDGSVRGGASILRSVTGDIIRVNLDAAGNSVFDPATQYKGFCISGLNFVGVGGVNGVVAIHSFRTRGAYRNLSCVRIDYLIKQPYQDASGNQTYCDMSTYENIHIIQSRYSGMLLSFTDGSNIKGFYFENPNATCKYGLEIDRGSCTNIEGVVHGFSENHATVAGGSFFRITNSLAVSFKGIHLESLKFETGFDIYYCRETSVEGLHTRFYSNDMFKITNSKGVRVKGWDSWENKNGGTYDFKYVGTMAENERITTQDCNFTSYPDRVSRIMNVSADTVRCFSHSELIHLHVYYDGAAWKVEDSLGQVVPGITATWDAVNNDGVNLSAPYNRPLMITVSPHYVVGEGPALIPQVAYYSPLKIFFITFDGVRDLVQKTQMNFDIIIAAR